MAHFNDFKIQCITSPLGTPMAMKCVEAALSQSFLNPFGKCNQMQRNCSEPRGDDVPLGFPQSGGEVGRKLMLCVSVQAQGSLASIFLLHGVCGKAPTAPNIASWAPKQYQRRSQLKPHASLCLVDAWGMIYGQKTLLKVSDDF